MENGGKSSTSLKIRFLSRSQPGSETGGPVSVRNTKSTGLYF